MEQHTIEQILQYASQFFGAQDDDTQLPATQESFEQLLALDERAITVQLTDEGSLISWMVSIPTSHKQMNAFLTEQITERELFESAMLKEQKQLEAVYLCAVFVQPEYRKQGYGRSTVKKAVDSYMAENSDVAVYTWPWNCAGRKAVKAIADQEGIEVVQRPS